MSRQHIRIPAYLQERLSEGPPPVITAIGNPDILLTGSLPRHAFSRGKSPWIALFCSKDCPGSLILPALDHVRSLREAGCIVASGFHSPMERECLKVLLRGSQPVIVCPARAIGRLRLPAEWQGPLVESRLLILSPFEGTRQRRMTVVLARERNAFVAALADEIFIVHARIGGSSFNLARELIAKGKKAYTIDDPANQELLKLGVGPLSRQVSDDALVVPGRK